MAAVPPVTYKVEVLGSDGVVSSLTPASYPVVEVTTYPPVGGGYDRVETLAFTKQGPLTITSGGSEFPVDGGNFMLDSIAARVMTAPTGAAVILNVLKNDASIFTVPANRPTIAAGTKSAVVGSFPTTMLAPGDWVEVTIAQIGSGNPGDTLVASVRMVRIG